MKTTVFQDQDGQFRWHTQADNNEIIATSGEGYLHRVDCVAGFILLRETLVAGTMEFVIEGGETT